MAARRRSLIASERQHQLCREDSVKAKKQNQGTMGLFGKKKKDVATGDYVDVEAANETLPVAIAVFPDAEPLPQQAVPVVQPAGPVVVKQDVSKGTIATMPQQQAIVKQAPPPNLILSREPSPLMPCYNCGRNARTRVTTSPNWITWCLVGLLLFVFWPLFWVPVRICTCKYVSRKRESLLKC